MKIVRREFRVESAFGCHVQDAGSSSLLFAIEPYLVAGASLGLCRL